MCPHRVFDRLIWPDPDAPFPACRIALVGNPNVGKSALFGRLTSPYAVVSNYPGTPVALTQGCALVGTEMCDLIDTPGVTAVEGVLSEDEQITRAVITRDRADVVVQVADARNIRRPLMLTRQVAGCGKPMVLVRNMTDEAQHGRPAAACGCGSGSPASYSSATRRSVQWSGRWRVPSWSNCGKLAVYSRLGFVPGGPFPSFTGAPSRRAVRHLGHAPGDIPTRLARPGASR